MTRPTLVEFQRDCFNVILSDLLSVAPYEGCALLIGDKRKLSNYSEDFILRVRFVWPCSNVWSNKSSCLNFLPITFKENLSNKRSKRNSFLLDPREQIHAQKWSRARNCEVLGSAHSHLTEQLIPSKLDLEMLLPDTLMIIMNRNQDIRAWWPSCKKNIPPTELNYIISLEHD